MSEFVIVLFQILMVLIPVSFFVALVFVPSLFTKKAKSETPQKLNVGKCTLKIFFKDGREDWEQKVIGKFSWGHYERGYGEIRNYPIITRADEVAMSLIKNCGDWIGGGVKEREDLSAILVPSSDVKEILISKVEDHWVDS